MLAIDKRRQPIDIIAVADELKTRGMLARLEGGESYLNDARQQRPHGGEHRFTTPAW